MESRNTYNLAYIGRDFTVETRSASPGDRVCLHLQTGPHAMAG
jgi:hypothetical protein